MTANPTQMTMMAGRCPRPLLPVAKEEHGHRDDDQDEHDTEDDHEIRPAGVVPTAAWIICIGESPRAILPCLVALLSLSRLSRSSNSAAWAASRVFPVLRRGSP